MDSLSQLINKVADLQKSAALKSKESTNNGSRSSVARAKGMLTAYTVCLELLKEHQKELTDAAQSQSS